MVRSDLVARIISPRGSHWAFLDEGSNVPRFVQQTTDEISQLALRQEAELTALEDARIGAAAASLDVGLERTRIDLRCVLTGDAVVAIRATVEV